MKLLAVSWVKSGAISTPARPANKLESIHENALTRSELMPASAVIRGLSTTARIRSPMLE